MYRNTRPGRVAGTDSLVENGLCLSRVVNNRLDCGGYMRPPKSSSTKRENAEIFAPVALIRIVDSYLGDTAPAEVCIALDRPTATGCASQFAVDRPA